MGNDNSKLGASDSIVVMKVTSNACSVEPTTTPETSKAVSYKNGEFTHKTCSSDDTTDDPTLEQDIYPSADWKSILQKYEVLPTVTGVGTAGLVRPCVDRVTGKEFAVKSIEKRKVRKLDRLEQEIEFLAEVDHPNIIRFVDLFEDEHCVHIVTEMCFGGELYDRIIENFNHSSMCFSERDTARIIHSLLGAVAYLHRHDIVHRDLKPENILFATKEKDSPIKLIDFGFSTKHRLGEPQLTARVGTVFYMAPELLGACYDRAVDLWSVGVIAFILLCGRPPFHGSDDDIIFDKIKRGQFSFSAPPWVEVSNYAKDFICCLLKTDPRSRWTSEMAMRHPWLEIATCDQQQCSHSHKLGVRRKLSSSDMCSMPCMTGFYSFV